jgi:methionine aminopeptidase
MMTCRVKLMARHLEPMIHYIEPMIHHIEQATHHIEQATHHIEQATHHIEQATHYLDRVPPKRRNYNKLSLTLVKRVCLWLLVKSVVYVMIDHLSRMLNDMMLNIVVFINVLRLAGLD